MPDNVQTDAIEATWRPEIQALRRRLDEKDAEIEQLRAELARWKPPYCGKIFPYPRPGEVVLNCRREVDHDGAHQAETGEVWQLAATEDHYQTEIKRLQADYDAAYKNYVARRDEAARLRAERDEIECRVRDSSYSSKQIVERLRSYFNRHKRRLD